MSRPGAERPRDSGSPRGAEAESRRNAGSQWGAWPGAPQHTGSERDAVRGRGSFPAPREGAQPPAGWLYPWQRYVALFLSRIARAGRVPDPGNPGGDRADAGDLAGDRSDAGHPGGAGGSGPYRPLCRTRACHYNRDWICCYDRVEPAPVAVMEASICPHALFLHHEEP